MYQKDEMLAPLGIIALQSFSELGKKIDERILANRGIKKTEQNTFLVPIKESRFYTGEGKVKIQRTVRGSDLYVLCDIGNYNCKYMMHGFENRMGPDEHFQDIKRTLSAINGKARRITVIMPLLYSSRQHRRKGRESLDCAMALQELQHMKVNDVLSFDVHDPNIQNAIHLMSFENLYPTNDVVRKLLEDEKDIFRDKEKTMIISPDTGAMDRAVYYSGVLGLDVGLFYKRRDLSRVVGGRNPIVQHEYMGRPIKGQNILIVDDMIASGESVIEVVRELKRRGAEKIFIAVTFAQFTGGTEKFDSLYREGNINKIYSTNLTYVSNDVREAEWFEEVDMSTYIADIIDTLNHDKSIEPLIKSNKDLRKILNEGRVL